MHNALRLTLCARGADAAHGGDGAAGADGDDSDDAEDSSRLRDTSWGRGDTSAEPHDAAQPAGDRRSVVVVGGATMGLDRLVSYALRSLLLLHQI